MDVDQIGYPAGAVVRLQGLGDRRAASLEAGTIRQHALDRADEASRIQLAPIQLFAEAESLDAVEMVLLVEMLRRAGYGNAAAERLVDRADADDADHHLRPSQDPLSGDEIGDPHVAWQDDTRPCLGNRPATGRRDEDTEWPVPRRRDEVVQIFRPPPTAATRQIHEWQRLIPVGIEQVDMPGLFWPVEQRADVVVPTRFAVSGVEFRDIRQQAERVLGPRLGGMVGQVLVQGTGLGRKPIGKLDGLRIAGVVVGLGDPGVVDPFQPRADSGRRFHVVNDELGPDHLDQQALRLDAPIHPFVVVIRVIATRHELVHPVLRQRFHVMHWEPLAPNTNRVRTAPGQNDRIPPVAQRPGDHEWTDCVSERVAVEEEKNR